MNSVDAAALVLRLTLGTVVLAHGINHAWGDGKLTGTAGRLIIWSASRWTAQHR
ncbi:hypothetical protein [Nocardia sp. NPDC055049]